jgi:endonuclease YncB( thermonuclease family)
MLRLLTYLVLATLAVSDRSHADDMPESPAPHDETELRAGMFGLPQGAATRREHSVNYQIDGKVRSITDGDTITLTGRRNVRFVIRLSDMDTPETSHQAFTPRDCKCAPVPFRPGQAGGRQATEELRNLLAVGEDVRAECYELDDYGRSICHVFKGNTNINLESGSEMRPALPPNRPLNPPVWADGVSLGSCHRLPGAANAGATAIVMVR